MTLSECTRFNFLVYFLSVLHLHTGGERVLFGGRERGREDPRDEDLPCS